MEIYHKYNININYMLSSTLKNILENQKHKCDREKEVKQKILNTVLEKIKNYNTYGNTFCTFKVPPLIVVPE